MLEFLKNNPLVEGARGARFRPRSMMAHLLIFLLVMTVTDLAASIPATVYALFRVLGMIDPALLISGDAESMEQIEAALNGAVATVSGEDGYLLTVLLSYLLSMLLVIVFCRFIEKRPLSSMGLTSVRRPVVQYVLGLIGGLALFAFVFLILYGTGAVTVSGGRFTPVMLLLYLLGFLVYGAAQEVLFHGYLMISMTSATRTGSALIFTSVLYALMQVYGAGFSFLAFLNSFLFSLLLGMITLRARSLYPAMALHGAWYFAEGNLFGCVAGDAAPTHRVLSAVLTEGRELTNGGSFGPEGGAVVSLALILALALLLFLPQRGAAPEEPSAQEL